MLDELKLGGEFFRAMSEADARIAARVAAAGCQWCGGPLHVGHYLRKPRGGHLAAAGEEYRVRYSKCCGHCRTRTLPPSLLFLGRRVYFEAVVLWASAVTVAALAAGMAVPRMGVPRRTLKRWSGWWRTAFVESDLWQELRARFVPPPPEPASMPASMLARLRSGLEMGDEAEMSGGARLVVIVAQLLAPITTRWVPDGSRFPRGLGLAPEGR